MKSKEISKLYGIDSMEFETFLKKNRLSYDETVFGYAVPDSRVEKYVEMFKSAKLEQQRLADERKRQQEYEVEQKRIAMANMLITSGFTFDGYKIVKYSGYISGDDAVQVARGTASWWGGTTDVGESLMKSLVRIRRNALNELKEAAYALGCNAVIGVDFDYITLDPETANSSGGTTYLPYVFGVTANGNAVIIEKEEK